MNNTFRIDPNDLLTTTTTTSTSTSTSTTAQCVAYYDNSDKTEAKAAAAVAASAVEAATTAHTEAKSDLISKTTILIEAKALYDDDPTNVPNNEAYFIALQELVEAEELERTTLTDLLDAQNTLTNAEQNANFTEYILFMSDVYGNVYLEQDSIAYATYFPYEDSAPPFFRTDSVSEYTFQLYNVDPTPITLTYNKSTDTCSITGTPVILIRDPVYTTYKQFYDAAVLAAIPP